MLNLPGLLSDLLALKWFYSSLSSYTQIAPNGFTVRAECDESLFRSRIYSTVNPFRAIKLCETRPPAFRPCRLPFLSPFFSYRYKPLFPQLLSFHIHAKPRGCGVSFHRQSRPQPERCRKSFRMRFYVKFPCKSFRIRSYEKYRGGGVLSSRCMPSRLASARHPLFPSNGQSPRRSAKILTNFL